MTRLDRVGLSILLLFAGLVFYLAACDESPSGGSAGTAIVYEPAPSSSGGGM